MIVWNRTVHWHLNCVLILNRIAWNRTVFCIKMDLALNNQQWLTCPKTKAKHEKQSMYSFFRFDFFCSLTLFSTKVHRNKDGRKKRRGAHKRECKNHSRGRKKNHSLFFMDVSTTPQTNPQKKKKKKKKEKREAWSDILKSMKEITYCFLK